MIDDKKVFYMKKAYSLALKAKGFTSPNPAVGAVIVKNGQIISKGKTGRPGFDHAEVDAIKNCKEDCMGSAMYVTLEPCSIYGKTLPAQRQLLKPALKKLLLAQKTPIQKLLETELKSLSMQALMLNVGYTKKS